MRRVLKGLGWTLLAVVLLLVLAVGVILGTVTGSRWALSQVPGLELEGFDGRLGGQWHAQRLVWTQGGNRVDVSQPALAWRPGCLLKRTLCVNELRASAVDLKFPPGDEPPADEPLTLPDIDLPLALHIERIDIGPLRLNDVEQLQSLQLRADWTGDGLDIHALQVRREDLSLEATGRLEPTGQWPLQLQGDVAVRSPAQQPWALKMQIDGEVRDRVRLEVESQGYLNGRLLGEVHPLDDRLPAAVRLTASGFKASPELPDTLRVDDLELTANGNLQDGYRLLATSRLPGEGGNVRVALEGLVNLAGARLDSLELDAGGNRWVRLNGNLDWEEAITADARLAWREFPWRRLYPEIDEPPVALRELTAEAHYDNGNYLGNFAAALTGPAGDFSLVSPFSGDLGAIHLPQLELKAGQGRAAGSVSVGFAEHIEWEADLSLDQIDPAYWVAELPGRLGGSLASRGTLRDDALQADAALDLNGRLRGQPTRLQLQASGEGETWTLAGLDLRMGDNRVQGDGRLAGEALSGKLALDLPRLAQLWPGLEGRITGRASAGGTLQQPLGQVSLDGQGVRFEGNSLSRLRLMANLAGDERGSLELVASGIEAGETDLGELRVTANGTRAQHQGNLDLTGPTANLSMALDGGLRGEDWRGRLLRARLDASGQDWRLQAPATLERLASGRISLGSHCWASGPATLCAEDQRLMPDPQVRYRLRNFQIASLAEYFPEELAWEGVLSADIALDLLSAGPSGNIRVDAGPGTFRMREEDRWHDFPYSILTVNSDLTPQRVDSRLSFDGGELGELEVRLGLDPRTDAKPLDGEFRLRGLNLAVGRPFIAQVDRLEGQLNGSGVIGGSLLDPHINGQLLLSGGEISGSELPMSFEALQVRLHIEGQQATLDGDWRSGQQGSGRLGGSVSWANQMDVDLRIAGTRLPVVVEPFAELEVEPDLRIRMDERRLAISGQVNVPRGDITVRELPPTTVRVSEDAVIVGEDAEEAELPMELAMDINVEVGQDQLRFSGFGLTAELVGYLHIGDNMDARGELNLRNGRYSAYGQRLIIRRAQLLFTGPVSQPFLNIEAIRRIDADNVIAGLRITGSAEQPRTEVFSEPAMSQEQALSYLVMGRALGADTGDSNLLAQAALGLGLAGSSSLTGGVAQRLGIQDFQLDTEGSGAATSVVASGRLTERLSLRYGVGVFEPANTFALRYELTRRLFLEAASGLASSLDIFYRRDF